MSVITLEAPPATNGTAHIPLKPRTPCPIYTLDEVRSLLQSLGARCRAMVQGRNEVIDLILTALLADGHVLLEDHPGSGKTTLVKTLGESIIRAENDSGIASFRRLQFTPDMLPSDITGVTMFDPQSHTFEFRAGPIFANVVLADEINRTSPKVQAALLEAMAEKQVTVDNQTHQLEELFFVIATQNPLDQAGTYPLPKAQLDRFLFKIKMTYLSMASELEVLGNWKSVRRNPPRFSVTPAYLVAAREIIARSVHVSPAIHDCLVQIAHALRHDKRVALGISTRSLVLALPALQAWAVMQGRDFVSLQDIKALAAPLFCHRLDLVPGGRSAEEIVNECVAPVVETLTRKTLKG